MKFTLESSSGVHLIRSFAPGELRVGDAVYRHSVVMTAERVLADWPPQRLDELQPAHFEAVFQLEPEIVLLGCGTVQRFPEPALLAHILSRGIGCEAMETGAACRTFNILVQENRRVAAALMLW